MYKDGKYKVVCYKQCAFPRDLDQTSSQQEKKKNHNLHLDIDLVLQSVLGNGLESLLNIDGFLG